MRQEAGKTTSKSGTCSRTSGARGRSSTSFAPSTWGAGWSPCPERGLGVGDGEERQHGEEQEAGATFFSYFCLPSVLSYVLKRA
jgi:hypothetical protein